MTSTHQKKLALLAH